MKGTSNISGACRAQPRPGGRSCRAWVACLLTALWAAMAPDVVAGGEPSRILASYDFEKPQPAGPDTFRVFEHARGRVDLSTSFRTSGSRSLRIHEEPGNGCFSELLGFFEERTTGAVFVQFYLLLTDTDEVMNFAVAGRRWFLSFERGGHAVWLQVENGVLRWLTAGEWQPVFAPRAFTWYFVDLVVDVDRGEVDLAIFEEGLEEAIVNLRQPNAAGVDRSPVAYFSLIGDLEDRGRVTYYVDDLLIATDPAVRLKPFVAPGRRTFFVELYGGKREELSEPQREDLLYSARAFLRRGVESEAPMAERQADQLERAADEAFLVRDLDLAEELYGVLRHAAPERADRALLKLSDVYFLRGDLEAEKAARESIYGRLDFEELR